MLVAQVLMLDHNFANRCLFSEVKFVYTLLKKLLINVIQADNNLCTDGFDCGLLVWLQHIHCLSYVCQTHHIKIGLVTEHDRELL